MQEIRPNKERKNPLDDPKYFVKMDQAPIDKNITYVSKNEFILKGIEIPFWDLVYFMVKWMIASIPACIIFAVFIVITMGIFGSLIKRIFY